MQRNQIIVLGSLGVLAGLAWYQRKSAGAQAASVTALGQQSNNNIAASILGSLAPVASSNSAKAQAAYVVDSHPIVAAPAPAAQPFTPPVLVAGPGPAPAYAAPQKMSAADINANINRIGVADDAHVAELAAWGKQNGLSVFDLAGASGYNADDVSKVFSSRGILYGF